MTNVAIQTQEILEPKYPESRSQIKKAEKSQWDIGDALLKEIGPAGKDGVHNDSSEKFEELSKILAEEDGIEYLADSLRKLRDVAEQWPAGLRNPAFSWSIHNVFRSVPSLLNECHSKITVREARIKLVRHREAIKAEEALVALRIKEDNARKILELNKSEVRLAEKKLQLATQEQIQKAEIGQHISQATPKLPITTPSPNPISPKIPDVITILQGIEDALVIGLKLSKTLETMTEQELTFSEETKKTICQEVAKTAQFWNRLAKTLHEETSPQIYEASNVHPLIRSN